MIPTRQDAGRALRAVVNAAVFIASMLCAARWMERALPQAKIPQLTEKIAWFAAHQEDYDAVFIGSSQFYHGIDPRQFDREAGGGTRSFNFGLRGMWPAESFFVLRQILAQHPRRLRWVFIDWMDIDPRIDPKGTTRRMIHWHDTRHTAITLRRIAEMPDPWLEKTRLAGAHLMLWARCLVQQGRAVEWFEGRLRKNNYGRPAKTPRWAEQDGWGAGDAHGIEGSALAEYSAQLDSIRAAGPRPPMGAALDRALSDLAAEVRAAGASPILIASPAADLRHRFAPPAGIDAWIFNDPERNPGLFEPGLRFDSYHLNPTGAAYFTQLLAGRFAESQKPRANK